MLRNILSFLFLLFQLINTHASAQQTITAGQINYTEIEDPEQKKTENLLKLGPTYITFSFSDQMIKMHKFQIVGYTSYKPSGNPEKGSIIYEPLLSDWKHYTEPQESDYAYYMHGIDIGKFKTISYDKRDTKTILGYECYRANLVVANGDKQVYYITDKIKAPGFVHRGQTASINGYPLEIQLLNGNSIGTIYRATEILAKLPAGCFKISADIAKEPMHQKKQQEVAKLSPDIFDNYMGYKLGSKKSNYPKKNFEEYVKKDYFYINNDPLDSFFNNKVYRCNLQFANKRITEITVELDRYKEPENFEQLEYYVNSIVPAMEATFGECKIKTLGEVSTYTWKGQKVQVMLTLDTGKAPTFLGGSLPYFRRKITLTYL